VQELLKHLTEAIDNLESDAMGIYDTKPPYGSCGGEWIKVYIFFKQMNI